MTFAHAATNILNDFFDTRYGVDTPDSPTARYRRHPLIEGMTKPRKLLAAALVFYAAGIAVGVFLTVVRGWPILALTSLGILASVLYSGGPFRYKPRALGEVSVFAMWGPLTVGGAAFVQSASAAAVTAALLVSLPQGLWVALVIFANNLKDIGYDSRKHVRTLAGILGRRRALAAFAAAVAATYVLVLAETAAGVLGLWGLLVLLSLPVSISLVLSLRAAAEIPPDADPRTAAAAMLFGALLIAALIVDRIGALAGARG
jgi:1,4-dihydroxy-2-naphthoate octaprenyltransferase